MSVLGRLRQCPGGRALPSWLALIGVVAIQSGCKSNSPQDQQDAGGPPVNNCATKDMALSNPQCQLKVGDTATDYIRAPNDQVWYIIQLPASVDPRTLVQVTAGYSAPSSPVNLGVNLISGSDGTSLGRLADNHSQGAPRPVNFIVRYPVANGRLFVLLSDQSTGRPNYDVRNQFSLASQAIIDPDPNHPNNVVPTPIALTPDSSGLLSGSNFGYLSTTNEVDKFSVTVAPFSGRKIIYVHVAASTYNPPVPYLLNYAVLDPDGIKIAEDHVANEFLAPNLATARLAKPGTYTIVIQGYRSADSTSDIPGDLRARFDVDVKVMDDVDPYEPNDTIDRSAVTGLSLGGNASLVGRLSYVADNDWYAFDLPANSNPTIFHYRLAALSSGGRFPPIPKPFLQALAREVRVFTQVSGQPDNVYSCRNDGNLCPKGYELFNDPWARLAVETFCQGPPSLCLRSSREESVNFLNLRNFEGVLNVPPHSSMMRFFVVVRDAQDNWADDKDYQLFVEWLPDNDEATFYSGGVKQAKVVSLAQVPATGFPVPPPAATHLQGTLSYGYGRWSLNQVQNGQGVRAEADYDGIISDTDRYELDFPGGLTTPPVDRSWELQWRVAAQGSGASSYDLALELQFCDGDAPDGGTTCVVVDRSSRGSKLVLSYNPASIAAWHNPSGPYQRAYDRGTAPDQTVLARAYGCFCFEPRFIRGGKFFVNVSAVDRNTYVPASYDVWTALTDYPQNYPIADGGTASCPVPVADAGVDGGWGAGCQFTRQ